MKVIVYVYLFYISFDSMSNETRNAGYKKVAADSGAE